MQQEAVESCAASKPVTTMMLRNIPHKYTQEALVLEIDETGFRGMYDFLYLPMDVQKRSNLGYAFVNFRLPQDAANFGRSFHDHRFRRFSNRKTGTVCVASLQGLDLNILSLNSRFVSQMRASPHLPVILAGPLKGHQQRIPFEQALSEAEARSGTARPVGAITEASSDAASTGSPTGNKRTTTCSTLSPSSSVSDLQSVASASTLSMPGLCSDLEGLSRSPGREQAPALSGGLGSPSEKVAGQEPWVLFLHSILASQTPAAVEQQPTFVARPPPHGAHAQSHALLQHDPAATGRGAQRGTKGSAADSEQLVELLALKQQLAARLGGTAKDRCHARATLDIKDGVAYVVASASPAY